METPTQSKLYVVNVEDVVVQSTTYIVKALDKEHAAKLISEGMFAFESEIEVIDNIESEIKSVEELK
jgi:hypothetical protein